MHLKWHSFQFGNCAMYTRVGSKFGSHEVTRICIPAIRHGDPNLTLFISLSSVKAQRKKLFCSSRNSRLPWEHHTFDSLHKIVLKGPICHEAVQSETTDKNILTLPVGQHSIQLMTPFPLVELDPSYNECSQGVCYLFLLSIVGPVLQLRLCMIAQTCFFDNQIH